MDFLPLSFLVKCRMKTNDTEMIEILNLLSIFTYIMQQTYFSN